MSNRTVVMDADTVRAILRGEQYLAWPLERSIIDYRYPIALENDTLIYTDGSTSQQYPHAGDCFDIREPWCYFIVDPDNGNQRYWYEADYEHDVYPGFWDSHDKWESPWRMPFDARRLTITVEAVKLMLVKNGNHDRPPTGIRQKLRVATVSDFFGTDGTVLLVKFKTERKEDGSQ